MIGKKDLLAALKESLDTEEKAIPIYTRHLDNTLFLSGFSSDEQKLIKKILSTLKKESEHHKELLESLILKINGSDKDVY